MNAETLAIEAAGLRKEYGQMVAVESLDLAVARGEVFGFLGPNGAGKTTSVKMFLGLAKPSAGSAAVLGNPLGNWQVRERIGFLPEHFRFQEWLKAAEFLDVHGRLYGMPTEARRERIGLLLEQLQLSRHANKPLRDFSKGMLQRIGLAQALLNQPDLVILDEPTSGLDPLGRRLVREAIQTLKQAGAAVFLNSHLLSEIEITCDRVAFIRHGRVVQSGPLTQLLAGATEVDLRLGECRKDITAEMAQYGWQAQWQEERLLVRLNDEEAVPPMVAWLSAQGVRIYSVVPRRLSLEELFLQLMQGEEAG